LTWADQFGMARDGMSGGWLTGAGIWRDEALAGV
jgi:hypothetical protein